MIEMKTKSKYEELYYKSKRELMEGDIPTGFKLAKEALKAARKTEKTTDVISMLFMVGYTAYYLGEREFATKCVDEATEKIFQLDRNKKSCDLAQSFVDITMGAGDTVRAKRLLIGHLLVDDTSKVSMTALTRLGLCLLGEGEPTKALVYFRELHDRARSSNNKSDQIHALLLQARVYSELGDYIQAIRLLELGCRMGLRHKQDDDWVDCASELAYVYSQVGFHSKAMIILSKTLDFLSNKAPIYAEDAKCEYDLVRAWSEGNYEFLLRNVGKQLHAAKESGFNKSLLKALECKAVALNGLRRFKEAQETVWDFFDAIDGNYSQYWISTENGLNELATALEGQNYTELSAKARGLAQRAFQIRVDRSIAYAKKITMLQQLSLSMKEVITFLRLERIPIIRYRGRVIQMIDGSFSIDGKKSEDHLTLTERKILKKLWANRGKYFSDNDLVKSYNEDDVDVESMTTNKRKAFVHVSNINKKLEDKEFIENETGSGYRIAPE